MTALLSLFGFIPGWLYAALLAAAMATNCATSHQRDSARFELSSFKAQHAEAARAAEASARSKEQAAATALATIEQKASDEKKRLSADLAAAHRELRNRPERPSGGDVPKGPADSVGCSAASLYAEDSDAFVREASRADSVRLQLANCQAAYDSAVRLTN